MSSTSQLVSIYGLIDPRTDECRYVGKAKRMGQRLKEHLQERNLKPRTHKNGWLKNLVRAGFRPEIVELESVTQEEVGYAEQFWIDYFRFLGVRLTNAAPGGIGGYIGAEGHKRQADALRGKSRTISDLHRCNIAIANRKKAADPVWLEKISKAQKKRAARDRPLLLANLKLASNAPRTASYLFDCRECGDSFATGTKKQVYCGKRCAMRAWSRGERVAY